MDFLERLAAWFGAVGTWTGPDGIPTRLFEHLALSAIPLLIAMAIALPLGLWIGHTGRGATVVVNLANVGRAIPSLAILVIVWQVAGRPLVDLGLRREAAEVATAVAMVALAIPPMVTNTYVGLRGVDRELVEAARGMGMRARQVLWGVELPVAMPVVLAGIRTAAVQVVATATLGAIIGTGGLGRYIVDGIAQRLDHEVFAGAVMVAALSIGTELFFSSLERKAASPGLASPSDVADTTAA